MSEETKLEGGIVRHQTWIDGRWCAAASGRYLDSWDPSTGTVWARIPQCDAGDVARATQAAHRAAFEGPWSTLRSTQRGAWLRKLGQAIAADVDRLALAECRDNGKRLVEVRAQIEGLPEYFDYFAGLADKFEGSVIPLNKPDMFNYTVWEPYGVVAAITAWNSPLALLTWKIAPALAAGRSSPRRPAARRWFAGPAIWTPTAPPTSCSKSTLAAAPSCGSTSRAPRRPGRSRGWQVAF